MGCPFLAFVLKCGRGVLVEDSKLSKCKKFENHHRSDIPSHLNLYNSCVWKSPKFKSYELNLKLYGPLLLS